jgi:glycosyltransferase involved in cell wall biosynthesis
VAIPTYNPGLEHLELALRSVLDQAPGPDEMEIFVVDDCSPKGAPVELVKRIGGGRVQIYQNQKNLRLPGIWNDCIARSHGHWVHILHQDDYVLPGFYRRIAETTAQNPEAGLIATRTFYVDEEGAIFAVSKRLKELERVTRSIECFFYDTPILCAGVAVRRAFYEQHGAFLPELNFKVDCEMWARAVELGGGIVIPDVLSAYRLARGTETARLMRSGEDLRDMDRFNRLFAERYAAFDLKKAQLTVCNLAFEQAARFAAEDNTEAAVASMSYWRANAPIQLRLRKSVGKFARGIFN